MENGDRKLQISDVMTRRPVKTTPETTIDNIAATLDRYHVSSILVVEAKKLVGIITSDDITYRVVAKKLDPSKTTAKEIMSTKLAVVEPSASVRDAVQLLNDEKVRQLPVVDGEELVGYVTVKDILRIQPELVHLVTEDLKKRQEERAKYIEKYVNQDLLDEDLFE